MLVKFSHFIGTFEMKYVSMQNSIIFLQIMFTKSLIICDLDNTRIFCIEPFQSP